MTKDRQRKLQQGREIIHHCTVLIDFLQNPPPDLVNPKLLADLLLMRSYAQELVGRLQKTEDEL